MWQNCESVLLFKLGHYPGNALSCPRVVAGVESSPPPRRLLK